MLKYTRKVTTTIEVISTGAYHSVEKIALAVWGIITASPLLFGLMFFIIAMMLFLERSSENKKVTQTQVETPVVTEAVDPTAVYAQVVEPNHGLQAQFSVDQPAPVSSAAMVAPVLAVAVADDIRPVAYAQDQNQSLSADVPTASPVNRG